MNLLPTLCLSLFPQLAATPLPPAPQEGTSSGRQPLPSAEPLLAGGAGPRGSLLLWPSATPPAGYRTTPWVVQAEGGGGDWTPAEAYWAPTNSMSSAVLDGKLLVFGGWTQGLWHNSRVESFTPGGRGWRRRTDMPAIQSSAVVGVVNGMAYLCGGIDNSSRLATVQRYDPLGDAWTLMAPMPEPRVGAGGGAAGGRLWVVGGLDASGARTSSVFRYDPPTNTWLSMYLQLNDARDGSASAVVGDRVYLLGGGDSSANSTNRVTIYDTVTGDAFEGAPAPVAFRYAIAVVMGSEIHVTLSSGGTGPTAYAYDTLTGNWRSLIPPREGHDFGTGQHLAGQIHLVGGQGPGALTDAHEVWTVNRPRLHVIERE